MIYFRKDVGPTIKQISRSNISYKHNGHNSQKSEAFSIYVNYRL